VCVCVCVCVCVYIYMRVCVCMYVYGAVSLGLPARVCQCYVRVGVGSFVPPPTLRLRAKVRDNELKLESASPGTSRMHILSRANNRRFRSLFYFGRHKTTEQTQVLSQSDHDVYFAWPPMQIVRYSGYQPPRLRCRVAAAGSYCLSY
jgi:hypothetical protein